MTIRNTSSYINILIMLSIYVLFAVSPAAADEHVKNRHGYQHDSGIFSDHKKADKGNEFTGESAAWVFVIANITVVLSLLSKMLIKFIPPGIALKEKIRAWNNFQKKYLMFFHYVLNPISLIIAFVHFNLSQCRTSSLPESGIDDDIGNYRYIGKIQDFSEKYPKNCLSASYESAAYHLCSDYSVCRS